MRRVAIVGSRKRLDRHTVERLVRSLPLDVVVVSGGAYGPDRWAEEAARTVGLATAIHLPDLSGVRSRGESASRYYARNQAIVDDCTEVFALVAPERKGGTEDTIRRAIAKGIPVTLL